MYPGTDLPAAWVAALVLAAVRTVLALAGGVRESPWLVLCVVLWVGLPAAAIARALRIGSPRPRPGPAPERAEAGPIAFGLGIGLYTVPYVVGLAAPWIGVPAALRLALAVFAVLAVLGWGLASASPLGPDLPRPR